MNLTSAFAPHAFQGLANIPLISRFQSSEPLSVINWGTILALQYYHSLVQAVVPFFLEFPA